MNLFLINQYIKKLTKEDIYHYAESQSIHLTKQELDTLYFYIKNRSMDFFRGQQIELLNEIKSQVKPNTYSKIEELYYLYKDKI